MKFFETLASTGINDVMIQMKQDGKGSITVFITPKSLAEDSALQMLKPIYLTGTPEEIDSEFFGIVSAPLTQTQKVFSNIEDYEAQQKEVVKATASKKAEKDAAAKAKKEETKTEDSDEGTTAPEEKVVKVNHEKVLKDYLATIKKEPIINHRFEFQGLYDNLSDTEKEKAFIKKAKTELDAAIKKEADIEAAKAKFGFTKKEETPVEEIEVVEEEPVMTEQTSDIPEAIQEIAKASPNVIIATVPTPVEAQPIEVVKEVTPVPPTPVAPVIEYEEVQELQMIDTEFTREEYAASGWTDEHLLQNGKAHYVTVKREKKPSDMKLVHTFPKEV